MIFLFIALIFAIAGMVIQNILHYREKAAIFEKFMAGDYQTYRFYRDQYPKEVALKVKAEEEKLGRKLTPDEVATKYEARKF